jgi:toxin-antitoxin system PIN domain toxin
MIACDTNILFIALETSRPGHEIARQFLETHKDDAEFAICELSLMELYVLLRNPVTSRWPLNAAGAVALVQALRGNPRWSVLDYPGPAAGIMDELWQTAMAADFARRRVFDTRLALTLRHHGVTEFATTNVKDFEGFDFARVWNPLAETGA